MFKTRLQDCLNRGNLRVSDLARWLERPHSTVVTWLAGREPNGPSLDAADVETRLQKLEKMIRARKGFPLPTGLSMAARIAYLEKIKAR